MGSKDLNHKSFAFMLKLRKVKLVSVLSTLTLVR